MQRAEFRPFVVVALLALAGLLGAAPALAQPPPGEAASALEEGKRRYAQGDCEGALPHLRGALAQDESPEARLFVARCLDKRGNVAGAYEEMTRTLQDASRRAESDETFAQIRDAAAAGLALLERRVARLIVVVPDAPGETRVSVDDQHLPSEALGEPLLRPPGVARVRATAPGRAPVEKQVELVAGRTSTAVLVLPEPHPDPEAPLERSGVVRTAGFAVAGLGAIGLVAFVAGGLVALDKHGTLEDACGGARCTNPSFASTVDDGKTAQTVANVSLVVATVGLGTGGAMVLFGGPDHVETRVAWQF